MSSILIVCVGLLAQTVFSARTLVQWIMSEKAKKVLSPTIFWVLSLFASVLLGLYGWLRQDFALFVGQFISYFVYVWNLKVKGVRLPGFCWTALVVVPLLVPVYIAFNLTDFVGAFMMRPDVPQLLMWFGMFGQILLTVRFIYQWWYSRRLGISELPTCFWWMSLIGAGVSFIYGIFRLDIVLMLGQGFGLLVYGRNLMIGAKQTDDD